MKRIDFNDNIKKGDMFLAKIGYSAYDPNDDTLDNCEIEIVKEINADTLEQLLEIAKITSNNLRYFDIKHWELRNDENADKLLEIISEIVSFVNSDISNKEEVQIILLYVKYSKIKGDSK